MTQQEFYDLPEVQALINIQKMNMYGSDAHKQAHGKIADVAKREGVFEEYRASGGCDY